MSRREIVLLVSRAIALLQIIPALISFFTNLPEQLFVLSQSTRLQSSLPGHISWLPEMGFIHTFVRLAVSLLIALLFWQCGPMIERLLLPAGNEQTQ